MSRGSVSLTSMEYAACAHGSDDVDSCFGCSAGEPVGPRLPVERKRYKIRYSRRFIEQVRAMGYPRFPLRPLSDDGEPL